PAQVTADVGQRRSRLEAVFRSHGVEHIEQGTQLSQRSRHLCVVTEGQLEKSARQRKAAAGEVYRQVVSEAEIAQRPEIDPRVTGAGHLVEHGVPIRDAGQDAYGELEGAVADWRVGDDDVARFRHECSLGAVAIAGAEGRARGVRLGCTATTAWQAARWSL